MEPNPSHSTKIIYSVRVSTAYFGRGNAWSSKEEYDKAIEDYTTSIKINPNDANIYYNRGNAWYGAKDNDKAIKDYTTAIKINPDFAKAYNNRSVVWDDLNKSIQAEDDRRMARKIDPQRYGSTYVSNIAKWGGFFPAEESFAEEAERRRRESNAWKREWALHRLLYGRPR